MINVWNDSMQPQQKAWEHTATTHHPSVADHVKKKKKKALCT